MDLETPRYTGSEADSAVDMATTAAMTQNIVEQQLEPLLAGQTTRLSTLTDLLMERLFIHNAANTSRGPHPPSTQGGGAGSKPRSNKCGGGSGGGTGGARAEKPKRGYPGCCKPVGHTTDKCYQYIREEKVSTKAGKCARHSKEKKRESGDDEDP